MGRVRYGVVWDVTDDTTTPEAEQVATALGEDLPPLAAAVRLLELYGEWDPNVQTWFSYHQSVRPLFDARVKMLIAATELALAHLSEANRESGA